MTPDDLARAEQIRARADAATPGPWKVWAMSVLADPVGNSNYDDAQLIATTYDPARGLRTYNATFIGAARSDVPWLLDRLAEAQADIECWRQSNADLRARLQSWYDDPEKAAMTAEKERDAALDRLAAETAEVERLRDLVDEFRKREDSQDRIRESLNDQVASLTRLAGDRYREAQEARHVSDRAEARLAAETERADKAEAAIEAAREAHADCDVTMAEAGFRNITVPKLRASNAELRAERDALRARIEALCSMWRATGEAIIAKDAENATAAAFIEAAHQLSEHAALSPAEEQRP